MSTGRRPFSCSFGVPAAAALLLLLAIGGARHASAIVVYQQNTTQLLGAVCATQPDFARVCWPLNTTNYVDCYQGVGVLGTCPQGKLFDYVKRACRSRGQAIVCPNFLCPESTAQKNATLGVAPLSAPYGKFGEPGNYTIDFPKAGRYIVYCPVSGHCWAGMTITVVVFKNSSMAQDDYVEIEEFEEPMHNSEIFPRKYRNVRLPVGGKLHITWDEPVHFLAVFDVTNNVSLPVVPYPPQPVYKCPDWESPDEKYNIPVLPDETRLVNLFQGTNYTYNATKPGEFFFACPLATHCRMGQVFKATVLPAPAGYKPAKYTLPWALTSDNYEDMTLVQGDSVFFSFAGPHALSVLDYLPSYKY